MIELRPESQVTVSTTKLNWWRRRTLLEKKLLTGVVLVAGVIFSFLIDATLHWHEKPKRPCDSDQCIIASSDLVNQIDETVDPCENFYKFACGKLESRTHHRDTAEESIKKLVEKQLTNILLEPITDDDHPSLKYEKKLFVACKNEATDGTTLKGLKTILNDLGGWPVLEGEKWNENNFKLIDTIDKLKRVGLFYNMILEVRIEEEPPERNITVSSPWLYSYNDNHMNFFKKLMIDQAIAFGANESIAKEDMPRAFDFMVELNNLGTVHQNKAEVEILRLSMLELQLNYKGMDWLKYFQLIQEPIDTITEDDYVVFPFLNFPQQFLNLISATNNRTLANYILWKATTTIASLASDELLALNNQELCFSEIPIIDRNTNCLDEIRDVMYPTPSYFAFVKRHMPRSTREAAQEMFQLILNEFKKLISINSWLDKESKNKSYEWLKELSPVIGFNAKTVEDIYRKTYKPLEKNDSFLTSYLKLKKEILLEKSSNKKVNNYSNTEIFLRRRGIYYFKEERFIRVSAGLLQGTFNEDRPMYINYGVLGKSFGSAIASLFIQSISELWSEETKKIFKEKTSCVSHNSKYFDDEENNLTSHTTYYEKSFKIAQIIATKLAYGAYETWRSENSKELDLIGVNYTHSQLFWISIFTNLCFEESDNTENFYSDSEVIPYYKAHRVKFLILVHNFYLIMIELSNTPESKCTVMINKNWWWKRTRLEKKLLAGVVFVAGVMLSFLIDSAVYWHKQSTRSCDSDHCIIATADILNQIDEAVDPCNDFYKFACGKVPAMTSHKGSTVQAIEHLVEKRLINILTEPITDNDHPSLKYEKKLFAGCINEANNGTTLNVFKTILNDIGGWPVLMGDNWTEINFDLSHTLVKLKKANLFNEMILKVRLEKEHPERHFAVKGPTIFSRNPQFYKKIMIDQTIALGAEKSVATEDMPKAYDFMGKITKLNRLTINQTENDTLRLQISELQLNYKVIDWLKFVKSSVEPVDIISDDDYIVFPSSNFLEEFIKIMKSTNNRTLANYILWTATASLATLVSNELLDIHNQMRCLTGIPIKDRTAECLEGITQIIYPNPSYFITFVERHMPTSARTKVQNMFKLILKEFEKLISTNLWMDDETKHKTYKWVKQIEPIIGFNAKTIDDMDRRIYNHTDKNESFLISYLKLKRELFLKISNNEQTKNDPNITYFLISDSYTYYIEEDLNICISAGMLQSLYFDENRPMYINYGVLGKSIGLNLAYFYEQIAYQSQDTELWSEKMKKIFENKTSCVTHNSEDFRDEVNMVKSIKYHAKQVKRAYIIAVKLAYNAYKTWVSQNGNELNLSGLNYTNFQTFWISSLTDVCFEQNYDTEYNFFSDNEVVRQNFDFANDFHCVLDSKTNPTRPESHHVSTTKLNCWRKRTLLEKKLLTGVLLVAGVIFSFLIDATLHWDKKPKRPCDSDQCIIASSDLLSQIDETVDPCENFYKFACGKLESRTHHRDTAKESIKKIVEKQLTNILLEPITDDDHPSLKYEKKLFVACKNEATDGTTLKGLKKILNDLGGWPVLEGDKWNENNFKLIDTIEKLKRVGLLHNMILEVRLEEEPPKRNITVSSPWLFSYNDKHINFFKKLMIDQAIAFGANESIAKEDMPRAFDFMVELNNLGTVHQNKAEVEILRLSMLELQLNYKGMDWLKYFQLIQEPIDTITEDDYVVFPYLNFPQQFLNLISATNHRTLANYILWSATTTIASLASDELLALNNQLLCLSEIPITDRNTICLDEIGDVKTYKPLEKNDSFLTSYLKLKKEILLEESSNEKVNNYSNTEFFLRRTGIYYFKGERLLRVSAGLLQGTYFNEDRPMYINYGVLGKSFGSAIVFTFIQSISELWSEETKKIFKEKISCVSHNSKYFDDEENNLTSHTTYYEKSFKIAQIVATKLAYSAYETWRSENSKELDLIGVNYTHSQLFWISIFTNLCFEESYNTDYNFYSDSEVVRQNLNFADDFRCHLDSKMNSKNKCILF
ncbi:hypothetical protein FQR65_LT06859 [Abscondita terminalis]|nr:hypothetical protein FQR65_LT06859 [Abscondita terminalis]